jgi:hypothetical protein
MCFWKYVDGLAVPELFVAESAGDLDQQSMVRIGELDWAEWWRWFGKRRYGPDWSNWPYGTYGCFWSKRTYGAYRSNWTYGPHGTYG